jgi:thymidylate synthase
MYERRPEDVRAIRDARGRETIHFRDPIVKNKAVLELSERAEKLRDALTAVAQRLAEDPNTKRAVMSIFDPASDFGDSKDIPCNNWLHFLRRDDRLHLNVAVRANDVIWGFSGINVFEWSVLQEVMAVTAGARPGNLHWFVGTMHVYERHYATAEKILRNTAPSSPYHYGVSNLAVTTGVDGLDRQLEHVLDAEQAARRGEYVQRIPGLTDPFFTAGVRMMQIYNMLRNGEPRDTVLDAVAQLPPSDLRVAAIEYLARKWGQGFLYELPLLAQERAFLDHHFEAEAALERSPIEPEPVPASVR